MEQLPTPQEQADSAITTIQESYALTKSTKQKVFIIQLTNSNRGFSPEAIALIKQQLAQMEFDLPTHLSILPAGKIPSTNFLFDGLEELWSNSNQMRLLFEKIRQRPVR
ncbi:MULTISPECIES: hypothetical protein [unclassified Coleofasciculus]|uniref:hypothetical protein n=1 Tax=unclassified Coleofasciculus TaxID=2692782 RepID=UPI001881A454|nr:MULTISPECIES: hypothetical protein [unclassified Coleofasciculus]MBE9128649.1 hypothetical protein [Coleofasciculus sp. LEGE 07081]MBE9149756.1 hypothetical protein [Coleofasciculus sp. LEGE 07092]